MRTRVFQPRVLAALAGLIVAALVVRQAAGLDWAEIAARTRSADPRLLLAALGLFYTTYPLRAVRWRVLLENAGMSRLQAGAPLLSLPVLTEILYRGAFVNSIGISRAGDIYRAYLLRSATGFAMARSLGTVVTERLLDLAVLAAVVGVAALVVVPELWGVGIWPMAAGGLAVAAAAAAGLVLVVRCRVAAGRRLPTRFAAGYAQLLDGATRSVSPRCAPLLLALTAAAWLVEGATAYLVAMAVGVPLSVAAAIVAGLAAALLSAIPITPAGLGFAEVGVALLLVQLGVDAGSASAIAILLRVVTVWSIVVFGAALAAVRGAQSLALIRHGAHGSLP